MSCASIYWPALTDEELLHAYTDGEREALEELFRRHRSAAFRVAYRRLGNEADALDAVQEGFIKALRHLGGFRQRSAFRTWLLRIVMNASTDLQRRRGRRRAAGVESTPLGEDGSGGPPGPDAGGARDLEGAELRQALDEALASLPEAHRQTFMLHAEGELACREVAEVMGVPIGTVMSRLYYARQKLRAHLLPRMTS
jgi:RNA polymerase sigma-70 factor (ECF subfamily)